jgi:predicted ATP-binding protein involved in virulence
MLTSYYALDLPSEQFDPNPLPYNNRSTELPGLVVIEKPDTAIHPLLLEEFISLLRSYTAFPEDHLRQFILTTHNPILLNSLKPEEVRIVERDEHGFTTVQEPEANVVKTWFEHEGAFNLGDLWTTRLLGGVPE